MGTHQLFNDDEILCYKLCHAEMIQEVLQKHLKKNKGELPRKKFLDLYVNGLEGSPVFGNRFFDILAGEGVDTVSQSQVKKNIQKALKKYHEHQIEGEEAASPEIYKNAKKPENYDQGDVDTLLQQERSERTKRYLGDEGEDGEGRENEEEGREEDGSDGEADEEEEQEDPNADGAEEDGEAMEEPEVLMDGEEGGEKGGTDVHDEL